MNSPSKFGLFSAQCSNLKRNSERGGHVWFFGLIIEGVSFWSAAYVAALDASGSERQTKNPKRRRTPHSKAPIMKITRLTVSQVDLLLREGSYKWSGGKSVTVFDSTVVKIDTDAGVTGYGEVCPLGPFYLPAYAAGARTGISELGPHLIGEDPTQLARLNRRMDAALQGHPYVKSALDIACWDILGKAAGQPVCVLLGGLYGDDFGLYRAISQEAPHVMAQRVAGYRAEGYKRFQLKVGGDPEVDIERIRAVAAELKPGERLIAD